MLNFLNNLLYFLVIFISVLLIITLLSFILPSLKSILTEIKSKSEKLKNQFYTFAVNNFKDKTNVLIENFRVELQKGNSEVNRFYLFQNYYLKKLSNEGDRYESDLNSSINNLSDKAESLSEQMDRFKPEIDPKISEKIDSLDLQNQHDILLQRKKFGLTSLIYLLIVAAIVSINTFLMNEFWFSFGTGFRNLIPLFNITYAMLFALIFAILEFGTGVAHYKVEMDEMERDDENHSSFNNVAKMIIIFAVCVLALVELVAFAKISSNLKLGVQFGLTSSDFMYGFLNWFLAPFGPTLTLFLMTLGYKLTESFFLWRNYKLQFSFKNDLNNIKKKSLNTLSRLENVKKSIKQLEPKANELSSKLKGLKSIPEGVNFRKSSNQKISALITNLKELFESNKKAIEESNKITKHLAIKQLLLSTFFLFLWILLVHLTAVSLTHVFNNDNLYLNNIQLYNFGGSVSFIAFIISIFIGLAGYFIKKLLRGFNHFSDSEHTDKPILIYIYIILILAASLGAFILVATTNDIGKNYPFISCLITLVTFIALYYVGINIDDYLAVSYLVMTLTIFSMVSFSALSASLILLIIFCLAIAIDYLFEFIIHIGEAVRRLFKKSDH